MATRSGGGGGAAPSFGQGKDGLLYVLRSPAKLLYGDVTVQVVILALRCDNCQCDRTGISVLMPIATILTADPRAS
jgi:hypothetical protein